MAKSNRFRDDDDDDNDDRPRPSSRFRDAFDDDDDLSDLRDPPSSPKSRSGSPPPVPPAPPPVPTPPPVSAPPPVPKSTKGRPSQDDEEDWEEDWEANQRKSNSRSRDDYDDDDDRPRKNKRSRDYDDDQDDHDDDYTPRRPSKDRGAVKKNVSIIGILSTVKGIFSLPLSLIPLVGMCAMMGAIIGLLEGVLGLVQVKTSKGKIGKGFPVAGTILNTIALAFAITWYFVGNAFFGGKPDSDIELVQKEPPKNIIDDKNPPKKDPDPKEPDPKDPDPKEPDPKEPDPKEPKDPPKKDPPKEKPLINPAELVKIDLAKYGLFGTVSVPKNTEIVRRGGIVFQFEEPFEGELVFAPSDLGDYFQTRKFLLDAGDDAKILEETPDALKYRSGDAATGVIVMEKFVRYGSESYSLKAVNSNMKSATRTADLWTLVKSFQMPPESLKALETELAGLKTISGKGVKVRQSFAGGHDFVIDISKLDMGTAEACAKIKSVSMIMLNRSGVKAPDLTVLKPILSAKNCKNYVLDGLWVNDAVCDLIVGGDQVEGITLTGGLFTSQAFEVFGRCPKLVFLSISCPKTNRQEFSQRNVTSLSKLKELSHVTLENFKITNLCVLALSGLPDIGTLDLKASEITGDLRPLTKCQKLSYLVLSGSNVTSNQLQFLSDTKIENLELNDTSVGDELIPVLVKTKSLSVIELKKTKFTAEGKTTLKKTFSDATFD